MSSDNVKITKEEQIFLMEWFEVSDPQLGIEKFVDVMALEGLNSTHFLKCLKRVMKEMKI